MTTYAINGILLAYGKPTPSSPERDMTPDFCKNTEKEGRPRVRAPPNDPNQTQFSGRVTSGDNMIKEN